MSDWLYREGLHQPPAGELPSDWTASQLSAVCEIFGGGKRGMTKEKDYRSSGYPAFSAAGQDGFVERYEREADAVILSAIGANCGRCFPAKGRWATLANVQAILPQPNRLQAGSLFNYVNRDGYWPRSGTAQPFIKPSDIGRCWVAHPIQTEEQSIIAEILATVDAAIRETEAVVAKLRLVKAGLLYDLLTRGLDAHGHLRDPARHPEQFQNSPLGVTPKAWEVVRIDALAINHDGRRVPLKESARQGMHGVFPYFGASGIIDWVNRHIFDGDYVLLGEDGENVESRRLPLAFRASGKIWVNNHAHVFEPREGTDIRFLTEVLEFKDYKRVVIGSAQPKITQGGLAALWFQKPRHDEQVRIADTLEAFAQRLAAETEKLSKLHSLKCGLAHDLLTGRVRVKT